MWLNESGQSIMQPHALDFPMHIMALLRQPTHFCCFAQQMLINLPIRPFSKMPDLRCATQLAEEHTLCAAAHTARSTWISIRYHQSCMQEECIPQSPCKPLETDSAQVAASCEDCGGGWAFNKFACPTSGQHIRIDCQPRVWLVAVWPLPPSCQPPATAGWYLS